MKRRHIILFGILVLVFAASASAVRRSDQADAVADDSLIVVLELDGVMMGIFDSVEGLSSETEVIEFQDGNDPLVLKRPGRVRYRNIVLTKASLLSEDLWNWYQTVVTGEFERRNGSVIIRSRKGKELVRYNFFNAWPCSWKGVSLGVEDGAGPVEEIQLAIDRMERHTASGNQKSITVRKTRN